MKQEEYKNKETDNKDSKQDVDSKNTAIGAVVVIGFIIIMGFLLFGGGDDNTPNTNNTAGPTETEKDRMIAYSVIQSMDGYTTILDGAGLMCDAANTLNGQSKTFVRQGLKEEGALADPEFGEFLIQQTEGEGTFYVIDFSIALIDFVSNKIVDIARTGDLLDNERDYSWLYERVKEDVENECNAYII